jgi:hypothetical protein
VHVVSIIAVLHVADVLAYAIVVMTIVGLAGASAYTIRARIVDTWQSEAAGQRERADRLEKELGAAREDKLRFELEQQELRHKLKGDLAGVTKELELEKTKHDLSGVLKGMSAIHEELEERQSYFASIMESQSKFFERIETAESRVLDTLGSITKQQAAITKAQERLLALFDERSEPDRRKSDRRPA